MSSGPVGNTHGNNKAGGGPKQHKSPAPGGLPPDFPSPDHSRAKQPPTATQNKVTTPDQRPQEPTPTPGNNLPSRTSSFSSDESGSPIRQGQPELSIFAGPEAESYSDVESSSDGATLGLLDLEIDDVTEDDKSSTYSFDKREHYGILIANMNFMCMRGELVDVHIHSIDLDVLPAHKVLIAAQSSLFAVLFRSLSNANLYLQNAPRVVLEALHTYLYKPGKALNHKNWDAILDFASSFGIGNMVNGVGDAVDTMTMVQSMYEACSLTVTALQARAATGDIVGIVQAHASVVAAASPKLLALLYAGPFVVPDHVALDMSSRSVLRSLVDFIYSGSLVVADDTAQELLLVASRYEIPSVARACVHFITQKMKPTNVVGIIHLAQHLVDESESDWSELYENLLAEGEDYLASNLQDVLEESDEFLTLSEEQLLRCLTSRQDVPVCLLVDKLIEWRRHKPDERLTAAQLAHTIVTLTWSRSRDLMRDTFNQYFNDGPADLVDELLDNIAILST